MSIYIAHHHKK